MRLVLTLSISIIFSTFTYASHVAGGNITWERTPNGEFIFTLELIRDCSGISLPTSTQTINAPNGFITLNYSANLSGSIPLSKCITGNCSNGIGYERYIYKSNPVQLSGPIPATGAEYSWSSCCYRSLENTTASNIYISSVMYPANASAVTNYSIANASVSAIAINGFGPKSMNLGMNSYGAIDSVRTILNSPLSGASSPISWRSGYSSQFPLPDQSESQLNGPFYYNPTTGIASVDINDTNAMDEHYIIGLEHLYYVDGALVALVRKTVPIVAANNLNSSTAPVVSVSVNNTPYPYQRGITPPTFPAVIGQKFTLDFTAVEFGDSLLVDVQSILLDTNRSAVMNWSNYSNLSVSYQNASNSPLSANLSQIEIEITPDFDNIKEGKVVVNFSVQDFNCPTNEINMPVILEFKPTVSILKNGQSDTIILCPPYTDSIVASNFSNGAFWSPSNLVNDTTSANVVYTGSGPSWLYLQDTAANLTIDSVYVKPLQGSVSIAKANNNLQLFDSVGLSSFTWRLNAVDFLSGVASVTNPINGVYDLHGSSKGCNFVTDTVVVGSANGFAMSPNGASVLPNRQQLNAVYGIEFSISNGNLVTETFRVNEIFLYGINSTFNKNAFSTATVKLFDGSQGEIYSGTLALQPNSPSVVFLPQISLKEGLTYYLTLSGDTNAYYDMYQTNGGSYQLGSLASSSGLLEVKGITTGIDTNSVPTTPTTQIPALAISFSSTIGLSEVATAGFSLYPNPATDWLEISFEANTEQVFTLYNLQGQKIKQFILNSNKQKVDISGLAPGAYFLQNGGHKVKFIKS